MNTFIALSKDARRRLAYINRKDVTRRELSKDIINLVNDKVLGLAMYDRVHYPDSDFEGEGYREPLDL